MSSGPSTLPLDTTSEFFQVLTASYKLPTETPPLRRANPRPDHVERCRATINWTSPVLPETSASSSTHTQSQPDQPIYEPHGRWAWTHGLPLDDPKQLLSLRSRYSLCLFVPDAQSLAEGAQCSASIDSGSVGGKEIKYICRK